MHYKKGTNKIGPLFHLVIVILQNQRVTVTAIICNTR